MAWTPGRESQGDIRCHPQKLKNIVLVSSIENQLSLFIINFQKVVYAFTYSAMCLYVSLTWFIPSCPLKSTVGALLVTPLVFVYFIILSSCPVLYYI